ncbi:uncharacterized protein LOC132704379 isoform X1 [Cylas formicarius]|uniref:uncharacterized protein LOC132704379 isoform X1 n=1 Tax=Cylas formicarius TaxID=197179 RepID=UPI00295868D9|nr:uncharacterized protein LOC132704379 isoform X1 [Cylas formicarius]
MGDSSGGEGPPTVSAAQENDSLSNDSQNRPLNAIICNILPPDCKKTAEDISRLQYFDVPSDAEILREVAKISANIRTVNRKTKYEITDQGPFMVILEGITIKVGTLHPMNFGKLLQAQKVQGILKISRKGANKIGLEFNTSESANKFLSNETYSTAGGYNKYIPQRLVTCRGLVRDIGDLIDEDDFYSEAEAKVNIGRSLKRVKIVNVRRLTKRVKCPGVLPGTFGFKTVPSNDYIITFDGKTLPESISIYKNECSIEKYVSPVVLCMNCCRFGHWKNQCKSKGRCSFCSGDHPVFHCELKEQFYKKKPCPTDHLNHEGKCSLGNCEISPKPTCIHCKGSHQATDRSCPEMDRQKKINEAMAWYNLSFFEAAKLFPRGPKSSEFNRSNENFPPIHNTVAPVSQPSPRSASKTYSVIAKKRKSPQIESGYDRDAHRDCLVPPLTRQKLNHTSKSQSSPSYLNDLSSESEMDTASPGVSSSGEFWYRFENLKKKVLSNIPSKSAYHEIESLFDSLPPPGGCRF